MITFLIVLVLLLFSGILVKDLLTQNPAIFVEINNIFDISNTPFYYTGRPPVCARAVPML